ncbi:MarR family winged helix-turn-helix transcriptional regulator [Solirubrobacter ginsenosidimutans]|uniref:MarR family winged helix-turn-helix transcriptional regulator n=1 Tax=Solirubrobacter ginsenosidimutans TaxID=490573 RepID=A0A9X3MU07_9ACTN|nr:MarR family winged helix-turn-helix transcriptional regulator [Solirubrobacter ginsenosidimutans]MDA0161225.1 MarR family winged helix-turn-helix transcriptional regulator [Solirubrobacter ginsenosidimutans]
MSESLQPLGLAVKRLQWRHHRALDKRLREVGLSLVQWDALRHIENHPGSSLHQLAQLTFQSDQAFGTLAARLIARGYITRAGGHGRALHHELTDAGRERLHAGATIVDQVLAESFAPLNDDEQRQLHALLTRLLETQP